MPRLSAIIAFSTQTPETWSNLVITLLYGWLFKPHMKDLQSYTSKRAPTNAIKPRTHLLIVLLDVLQTHKINALETNRHGVALSRPFHYECIQLAVPVNPRAFIPPIRLPTAVYYMPLRLHQIATTIPFVQRLQLTQRSWREPAEGSQAIPLAQPNSARSVLPL